MTPSPDYDVLEGLAKAATPGPWQNGIEDLEGVVAPQQPGLGNVICVPPTDEMYSSYDHWQDNAAFIAAANPTTILALVAKARAGEAAVEASEIVQQFVTRIMMERRCNNLGPNVAEPIMTRAQAFLAALQDQPQ